MADIVSSRGRQRRFKAGDVVTGYDGRTFKVLEIELVEDSKWGEWQPRAYLKLTDRDATITLTGKELTDLLANGANSGARWLLGRNID